MTYQDNKGNLITVEQGPYGNWTWYRKKTPFERGQRIKAKGGDVEGAVNFYKEKAAAQTALDEYARDHNWKPYTGATLADFWKVKTFYEVVERPPMPGPLGNLIRREVT